MDKEDGCEKDSTVWTRKVAVIKIQLQFMADCEACKAISDILQTVKQTPCHSFFD